MFYAIHLYLILNISIQELREEPILELSEIPISNYLRFPQLPPEILQKE